MAILSLLVYSLYETCLMVSVSLGIGIMGGCAFGILLFYIRPQGLKPHPYLYYFLGFSVNSLRSIPYVILIVLLIPLTRLVVGSSIGTWAAIIPLSLASILLIARATEDTFRSIPQGLIEMGVSMGAPSSTILFKIVLPEALSILISHITNITITLIGFSAMAGTVGGGGLGDLAIRYGYQRYDTTLMILIVFILLCLVQIVQTVGERLSHFYQYH